MFSFVWIDLSANRKVGQSKKLKIVLIPLLEVQEFVYYILLFLTYFIASGNLYSFSCTDEFDIIK